MTETTQTQPQCPRCGERIRLKIHRSDRKQWKCGSCGKYFTFPKPQKTCVCGIVFTASRKSQKYHSSDCNPRKIKAKIKTCPICKTEFQAATKYCSLKCYDLASEQRKAEEKEQARLRRLNMPKIVCAWCGDLFRPLGWYLVPTCCPDCSYQYHRMMRRIYKAFNSARIQQELDKLKTQGKNYQLPERDS